MNEETFDVNETIGISEMKVGEENAEISERKYMTLKELREFINALPESLFENSITNVYNIHFLQQGSMPARLYINETIIEDCSKMAKNEPRPLND